MTKKEFILKHFLLIISIILGFIWIFFDKMEPIIFILSSFNELVLLWIIYSNVLNTKKSNNNLTPNIEKLDNNNLTDVELNKYYSELFLSKTKADLINLKNRIDRKYNIKNVLFLNSSNEKFSDFYNKLIASINNSPLSILMILYIFVLFPHLRQAQNRWTQFKRRILKSILNIVRINSKLDYNMLYQ